MKIGIIGAGFTGLAAGLDLAKAGHLVTIFDQLSTPGGIATGFRESDWDWSLEWHYHHVFEGDKDVLQWLTELNLRDQLIFYQTLTSTYQRDQFAQLDNPLSLLQYPRLSFYSKIRTGVSLALLKLIANGVWMEKYQAKELIQRWMGQEAWQMLWAPLFEGKFGNLASQVNAAWFWARVHARSKRLGYYQGGFLKLAEQVQDRLIKKGATVFLNTKISQLRLAKDNRWICFFENKAMNSAKAQKDQFDTILFTGNTGQLLSLADRNLSANYRHQLGSLKSLAAMTLVLELDQPFFQKQPIYWLNINQSNWPFLAVVEHTNLVSATHYDNRHLVYVGKYLSEEDSLFSANLNQVLTKYHPFLEELSPGYKSTLIKAHLFRQKGAQPIVKKNHSQVLPQIETPIRGLYFAGMQHVYPYDRGINYAVKLGRQAAHLIQDHS